MQVDSWLPVIFETDRLGLLGVATLLAPHFDMEV